MKWYRQEEDPPAGTKFSLYTYIKEGSKKEKFYLTVAESDNEQMFATTDMGQRAESDNEQVFATPDMGQRTTLQSDTTQTPLTSQQV